MTQTEQLLKSLVEFPTVSRDSNLALIEFIQQYLARHGVQSSLTYNTEQTKANLYAVFGPGDQGGVMLSGHTDVVPTEGQSWSRDPFILQEENQRYYGRGTTDMKGYIAAVLAQVPEAVNRDLRSPIHLAFSYDEEIGCVGVRRMIEMMESAPQRPDMCIVGEPTSLNVGIAHKGKTAAICRCHGVEAHSALATSGLNAIFLATEMIQEIRSLQQDLELTGCCDHGFGVPNTTLHVGTISGGTALNIIPNYCEFRFEIRNLHGDRPEELLETLRQRAREIEVRQEEIFPSVSVEIEVFNQYPAMAIEQDHKAVSYVRGLLEGGDLVKLDFGTEGGLFQDRLTIPTVICGPGSMDQGHKPDEYIERSELARCDAFLSRLVDSLCR